MRLTWLLMAALVPTAALAQATFEPDTKRPYVVCVQPGGGAVPCVPPPPADMVITNKSGTIASGGAINQIAIPANANRVYCSLQPQTMDLFVNAGTTAPLSNVSKYATTLTDYTCPDDHKGHVYKGPVAVSGLSTGALYQAEEGTEAP